MTAAKSGVSASVCGLNLTGSESCKKRLTLSTRVIRLTGFAFPCLALYDSYLCRNKETFKGISSFFVLNML